MLVSGHVLLAAFVGVVCSCLLMFRIFVPAPFFFIKYYTEVSILVLWVAFGIAFAMRHLAAEWWILGLVLMLGFNAYFFIFLRKAPIKLV